MAFEYKIVRYEGKPRINFKLDEQSIENKMNYLAVQGWELVTFTTHYESFFSREKSALAVFKRIKN